MQSHNPPQKFIRIIFVSLWLGLFLFGLFLAKQKLLWNDEVYTQVKGIEKLSYAQIFLGKIPEGNNSPLFYVLQKATGQLSSYKFPFEWREEWVMFEPKGQVILRILPNLFMSLSIALIVCFFILNYSWWAGLYAFLASLSSLMVWAHWVEARPYGLWFLLTTLQFLIFLKFLEKDQLNEKYGKSLAVVHILLSLTVFLSVVQNVIVSFILWFIRRDSLKNYFTLTFVPLLISFVYYALSPRFSFSLPPDFFQLVFNCFHWESIVVLLFLIGFMFMAKQDSIKLSERAFLIGAGFIFLSAFSILGMLILKGGLKPQGFEINARYFIYLTPVAIISTTIAGISLGRMVKSHQWIFLNWILILSGLLVLRFLKTYVELSNLKIY